MSEVTLYPPSLNPTLYTLAGIEGETSNRGMHTLTPANQTLAPAHHLDTSKREPQNIIKTCGGREREFFIDTLCLLTTTMSSTSPRPPAEPEREFVIDNILV